MAAINKNQLVKNIKESLDLRRELPNDYVEYMMKLTVMDVSRKFSTLFHTEDQLDSNSSGIIELPADAFRIISVQYGTQEAEPLDLRDYNIYANRTWTHANRIFATAKQEVDKVQIKLLPVQAYTDVLVIYQSLNDGVGNIPAWHEDIVFWGTRFRYLASKRAEQEKIVDKAEEMYTKFKNQLTLEQNKMYPNPRWKNHWEAAWERNFLYELVDETRDLY